MYNENLTGKNLNEVIALLAKDGVTDVTVVGNDTKGEYKADCELVVKANVSDGTATLITSKFLLRI